MSLDLESLTLEELRQSIDNAEESISLDEQHMALGDEPLGRAGLMLVRRLYRVYSNRLYLIKAIY